METAGAEGVGTGDCVDVCDGDAEEDAGVLSATGAAEEAVLVAATGSRLIVERASVERPIPVLDGVTATVAAPVVVAARPLVELFPVDPAFDADPLVEVFAPVVDKIRGGVRSTTVPRSETGA